MARPAHPTDWQQRGFVRALGLYAILGTVICIVTILIADFVVPDHDWVADTISDLGAGRYEWIVDIGLYAFAGALTAISLMAAHVHLGRWSWSLGSAGFALLGYIVFLVGARNEYGDKDFDGTEIHIYLVYALALLMALLPWAMRPGLALVSPFYPRAMVAISLVWIVAAPIFRLLPDDVDGAYERFLGLIMVALVAVMARALTLGRRL